MGEVLARFEQRERLYAPDKDYSYYSAMSFHIWPCKFVQGYYKPLSRLSGKCIFSEKRNFAWSDMTLTLDLQTSSKVSAHPLSKDTEWNISQIRPRWEKDGQMGGKTEGQTDQYRTPAERGPNDLHHFFISAGNRFPTIQIYK